MSALTPEHEKDDDADFAALMARSNPARTPVEGPVTDSIAVLRERLKQEELRRIHGSPAKRRGRRLRAIVATAAVAVVVAVAVTLTMTVKGTPATAAVPEPLVFSAPSSTAQVIDQAIDHLATGPRTTGPLRMVKSVSWSIDLEDGAPTGPVTPEFNSLEWKTDLSGRSLSVKARTEPGIGSQVGRVVPTDEVVSDLKFDTGQFGVPSVDPPAETDAGMHDLLTSVGMPAAPTGGQVVESIMTAMELWTLTDKQHASMLRVLEATGQAESVGDSVDRLGRRVAGLTVESTAAGVDETLLISADSGRIVGVESHRRTATAALPAGTVIEYRMWNPEEGKTP